MYHCGIIICAACHDKLVLPVSNIWGVISLTYIEVIVEMNGWEVRGPEHSEKEYFCPTHKAT